MLIAPWSGRPGGHGAVAIDRRCTHPDRAAAGVARVAPRAGGGDVRVLGACADRGHVPARRAAGARSGVSPWRKSGAFWPRLNRRGCGASSWGPSCIPGGVPQMADTDALFAGLDPKPGVTYSALVLNMAGLDRGAGGGRAASVDLDLGVGSPFAQQYRPVRRRGPRTDRAGHRPGARRRDRPARGHPVGAGLRVRGPGRPRPGRDHRAGVRRARGRRDQHRRHRRAGRPAPGVRAVRPAGASAGAGGRAVAAPARHPRAGSGQHGSRGCRPGCACSTRRWAGSADAPSSPMPPATSRPRMRPLPVARWGWETGIDWRALAAPVAQAEAMLGRRLPARVSHVPPPPQQAPQCPRHAGGD
jgi:hydroxymethylglutaryl-CoA lyase